MATIEMRNDIFEKFGKDSFEGHYIQHLFADRDAEWVEEAYKKLLIKYYSNN